MRARIRRALSGHRTGESHHRAKCSDHDVYLARALHTAGLGYGAIANKLSDDGVTVSRYTVRDWCKDTYRL